MGSLFFIDNMSGQKIEVEGFDSTIRNLSYRWTDNADPFKNVSFTGDIRCRTLKINNLALTNVVMTTAGGNGIFDISPVSMNVFGGTGRQACMWM